MSYEKTCTTCACNWVCDHNNNGFETCGNWIPKWISVEERLPEPFEDVLTRRACGIDVEHYEGGKSWRNDHTAEPWPVTHWMPLPEPPKEDS